MARPSPRLVLIVLLLIIAPGVVPPPLNAGSPAVPLAYPAAALPLTSDPTALPPSASPTPTPPTRPPALNFEPNAGQADPAVRFLAHAPGGLLLFTPGEVVLALSVSGAPTETPTPGPSPTPSATPTAEPARLVRLAGLRFLGAAANPTLSSNDALTSTVSYFRGADPAAWHANLPAYSSLTYHALYPGVDLGYSGATGQLKGTYTVAAGADPTRIRWRYDGAGAITRDAAGALQIRLQDIITSPVPITLTEQAPIAWQQSGSTRLPISVAYRVAPDASVSFVLGSYNPALPLTIDPTWSYSTYLGGSGADVGHGVAIDTAGNAYIVGTTVSSDFPLASPIQKFLYGYSDVFVSKLNTIGSQLVYSTYLGGSDEESGQAIAVDAAGAAYLTGTTYSRGGIGYKEFPTTPGAFQPHCGDPNNCHFHPSVFFTKISAAGTSLLYSTYFGGGNNNIGNGIAISAAGDAYITGWTASRPDTFPLSANAFQRTCGGTGPCAFVARLNTSGGLGYSTYLSGGNENQVNHGYGSIAVDTAGYAYVTGYTGSAQFPLRNPIQANCPACALGTRDAFVSKLNVDGSALVYSTFLGGSQDTAGTGIAVDSSGAAYVSGYTYAADHPTTAGAYRRQFPGGPSAFVTKVNPAGTAWAYSTYLMVGSIWMPDAIDSGGNVYVVGSTRAWGAYPVWKAIQPTHVGNTNGSDAVVLKLNAAGSGLVYATFLGGSSDDEAEAVVVDGSGNAYVTGSTNSEADFPHTPFAYQLSCAGASCQDGFVTKVPEIGGTVRSGPGSDENWGGGGVSACPVCKAGDPIDTASGNFWHSFTDLAVPGRGVSLNFSRTYNAQAINNNGPLGYGWTHSYNSWIDGDNANWYVHQASGAVAPFPKTGPAYPWVAATLSFSGGVGTFTPNQGQERYIFQPVDNPSVYRLTQIIDRNGYATSLGYSNGLLSTVADAANRTLTLTYTQVISNLLLTSVGDNIGRTATYTYTDGLGNLTATTDIGGQTTHFTYNTTNGNPILQHQLLTMTDPNGGVVTNTYDANTRLATQQDPLGRPPLQFSYTPINGGGDDPTGMQTTLTDSLGYTTVYTYDANRLTALTRNPGPGQLTWSYAYGAIFPTGVTTSTDPLSHSQLTAWDARGNRLSTTDPLGHTTRYAYNPTNDLLVMTDSLSIPITYTYDISGNLTSVARPWIEQNQVATSSYAYDPAHAGDVLTMTNALGKQSTLAFDAYGYVLTSTNPLNESTRFTHDAIGRLLSVVAPLGGTTVYTPSVYGLPLQARNAVGYTSVFTYDADLNLTQARDTNGRVVTTTYDLDNEPIRVTYPDQTHSDARYDAGGRVISQTNPLTQTTLYSYDSLNQLAQVTTPLTVTAVYTYDRAGNLTVLTNANGLPATFGYDDANQLRSITYADGQTPGVSFDYNALGMRTAMTDGTGVNLYSYDSLLRLTSYRNGASATVSYGYDLGGRLLTLTYPGSHTVTRGYDDANQLQSLRDWLGGPKATTFGYDHDGALISLNYANGVKGTLGYDAADQVQALTYTLGSNVFLQQTYSRDPAGVLAGATEQQSGVAQGTHTYSYDPLYRVTGDGLSGGPTTSAGAWSYDPATEITATSYSVNGSAPVTTTRGYNAGNELLTFLQVQSGTTQHSYALGYDPPGNRRSQTDSVSGQTTTYGYDQADRLTSWAQGAGSATYRYDGDGLRQSKNVSGTTTPFTWDVGAGLPLLLADATAQYIYGPGGQILEQIAGSTATYYHADHLGSVRALTNQSGAVVATYTYDAYGQPLSSTGSVANPFRYTGEYQDSESGLYYLRARYYDPAIQQFLTVDPLLAATEQAYAYAAGSPLNATDPRGLANKWLDDSFGTGTRSLADYQVSWQADWNRACAQQTATRGKAADEARWAQNDEMLRKLLAGMFAGGSGNFRGPAAKGFNDQHFYDSHHPLGNNVGSTSDMFPGSWSLKDISASVRRAWQERKLIGTGTGDLWGQDQMLYYRGFDSATGMTYTLGLNTRTKIVEMAVPKGFGGDNE